MNCLNCEQDYNGNYCPNCGQRITVKELHTLDVLREVPNSILNVEKRFWNTIKALAKNPFQLTKDYSKGKRKLYSPPIQFFFFFATISFIIDQIVGLKSVESLDVTIDSATNSDLQMRMNWAKQQFLHISENYANYFDLGLPLVFALCLALFFRKKFSYAEAVTFSFYVFGLAYYVPHFIFIPIGEIPILFDLESVFTATMVAIACASITKYKVVGLLSGIPVFILSLVIYALIILTILAIIYPGTT